MNQHQPPRRAPEPRRTAGSQTKQRQMSRDEARRAHALQMKKRRRRRRIVAYTLLLFFLLVIGVALSLTVFFRIETIQVEGNARYQSEDIIAVTGINLQDNLFVTDTKRAAQKLTHDRPYIRKAAVKRVLPATLVITVEETQAAFSITGGDGVLLLDSDAKVLETGLEKAPEGIAGVTLGELTKALPGETLESKNPADVQALLALSGAVRQAELAKITAYYLTDTDRLMMTYDGRIDVLVGNTGALDASIPLLAEVLRRNDASDPQKEGSVDLTMPGRAYFSTARLNTGS